MKLWLLRPREDLPDTRDERVNPWIPWYDKYHGFLIRAESEERAREMAQGRGGDETDYETGKRGSLPAWLSPEYSTCVELTADGDEGIIMQDFAGA